MDDTWVYKVKEEFPGLKKSKNWVLCDAAGGTQVHQSVITAISDELSKTTANLCVAYPSALNSVQTIARAREVAADFFNCTPNEIVFGGNMTTITNHLARSIGRLLTDENNVVVTELDHDANVSPWVQIAKDKDAKIRRINFLQSDGMLDLDELIKIVDEIPKLLQLLRLPTVVDL